MQGELWIGRLASDVSIAYEASEQLWKHFVSQLTARLSDGEVLDMEDLGCWAAKLRPEHIAQVAEVSYLIPPRIELMGLTRGEEVEGIPLLSLKDALVHASRIRPQNIEEWLMAIPVLTLRYLRAGRRVQWPSIGVLFPTLEEGRGHMEPCPIFYEALNRPFSMFSPIPLAEDDSCCSGLDVVLYDSLEDALAPGLMAIKASTNIEKSLPNTNQDKEADELPTAASLSTSIEKSEAPILPNEESLAVSIISKPDGDAKDGNEQEAPHPAPPSTTDYISREEVSPYPSSARRDWAPVAWILLCSAILGFIVLSISFFVHQNPADVTFPVMSPHSSALKVDTTVIPHPQNILSDTATVLSTTTEASPDTTRHLSDVALPQATPTRQRLHNAHRSQGPQTEEIILSSETNLMDIAKQKYGHSAFWVYIYEENRELLPIPTSPKPGLRLRLPAARKYGIDPNDTLSVSRALTLQRSLMR